MLPDPQTQPQDVVSEEIRNGRVVTLRCEGLCSNTYTDAQVLWISRMRAAGYSPDDVRARLSDGMLNRPHRNTRRIVNRKERLIVQMYACQTCGHERQYGMEEL
jgi:hypothetical protein